MFLPNVIRICELQVSEYKKHTLSFGIIYIDFVDNVF